MKIISYSTSALSLVLSEAHYFVVPTGFVEAVLRGEAPIVIPVANMLEGFRKLVSMSGKGADFFDAQNMLMSPKAVREALSL